MATDTERTTSNAQEVDDRADAEILDEAEKAGAPLFVRRNALGYLQWMYPGAEQNTLAELTDDELTLLGETRIEQIEAQIEGLDGRSIKARTIKTKAEIMRGWFAGRTVATLSDMFERTEGSVVIVLSKDATENALPDGLDEHLIQLRERTAKPLGVDTGSLPADNSDALNLDLDLVRTDTALGAIRSIRNILAAQRKIEAEIQVSAQQAALEEEYQTTEEFDKNFEAELITLLNVNRGVIKADKRPTVSAKQNSQYDETTGEPIPETDKTIYGRREQMHEYEIIEAFFSREFQRDTLRQLRLRLRDLVSRNLIFDETSDYYSTYREVPDEAKPAPPKSNRSKVGKPRRNSSRRDHWSLFPEDADAESPYRSLRPMSPMRNRRRGRGKRY